MDYARFHYHEAKKRIANYLDAQPSETSMFDWMVEDEKIAEFNRFIFEVGAHLTACVQSIHALPDILAHAVYFALGLNLGDACIPERDITPYRVLGLLRAEPDLGALAAHLAAIRGEGEFVHLSALANRAKHRSLMLPALSEDQTGKREKLHCIVFPGFSHFSGRTQEPESYPEVDALEFLRNEFDRCAPLVISAGRNVNAILRRRAES